MTYNEIKKLAEDIAGQLGMIVLPFEPGEWPDIVGEINGHEVCLTLELI